MPVASMRVRLEGSHTAFADESGARLDVRANGSADRVGRVGSRTRRRRSTSRVPAGSLRSVNDIAAFPDRRGPGRISLHPALDPTRRGRPEHRASPRSSVEHGTGAAKGFQLFPQIYEGTLPVALRAAEGRRASAAINAAALVAELQRAAGSPLEIQLMEPDAFLADDRSGLIVGALGRRLRARSTHRSSCRPSGCWTATTRPAGVLVAGPLRRPRVHRPQQPARAHARRLGPRATRLPPVSWRARWSTAVVNTGWDAASTATWSSPTRGQAGVRRLQPVPGAPPGGRGGEVLREVVQRW